MHTMEQIRLRALVARLRTRIEKETDPLRRLTLIQHRLDAQDALREQESE